MITQERLKQVISYDAMTGICTANVTIGRYRQGKEIGTTTPHGYRSTGIDNKDYLVHDLIWLYMTGEWPPMPIDHRDTDKLNNRWGNLRLATYSQNGANRKGLNKNNRSGIKGVTWDTDRKKWFACIMVDHKTIALGRYSDKGAAADAVRHASKEHFGEFARVA